MTALATFPTRDDDEDALTQRIRALETRGRPLPETLQRDMGQRFGTDFRDVRIHTDGEAADLASRIAARAFTWRHHIVFGPGAWQPETPAGRHRLRPGRLAAGNACRTPPAGP